jgi:hypothetical protein
VTALPLGRAPPRLVLCRQCVEYVYEGETICPHCGGDPRLASARYLAAGYAAIEAMQRLDRALESRAVALEDEGQPPRRRLALARALAALQGRGEQVSAAETVKLEGFSRRLMRGSRRKTPSASRG